MHALSPVSYLFPGSSEMVRPRIRVLHVHPEAYFFSMVNGTVRE